MALALLVVVAVVAVAVAAVVGVGWRRDHRRLERRLSPSPTTGDDPADATGSITPYGTVALGGPVDASGSVGAPERSGTGPSPSVVDRGRLEAVVMASLDAVVVVDTTGEVVLRNSAAERYHDARHADALAEAALAELLDAARADEPGARELELFGPPRSVLAIRAVPLHDGPVVVGAVAFIRDVSDARRTESIRRDFVANVSHELKTPIGALALLAETMAAGGDAGVNESLAARMVREADRVTQIIDDLLDLSLIESQESLERDRVSVADLLAEAVERVQAQAEAAETPLIVAEVSADLVVACDRGQVVGAITNLLDNALKYSDPGQAIECTATRLDDRAAISVRDHGIGIPARDLERIFERFYRVDRARSRATGGTGLGLSIVRHVADVHGGDVQVRSREGVGSTFTLTLRLERADGANGGDQIPTGRIERPS